jgi:hypothetical protein
MGQQPVRIAALMDGTSRSLRHPALDQPRGRPPTTIADDLAFWGRARREECHEASPAPAYAQCC